MKDPNETVHQYQFDGLGRATEAAVTAFGTGIDQAIKRIEITYDSKRSLRTKVTQYDAYNPTRGGRAYLAVRGQGVAVALCCKVDLDSSVSYGESIGGYIGQSRQLAVIEPESLTAQWVTLTPQPSRSSGSFSPRR